jgi:N-acetylmuramoyl-L-alanine amidase
MLKLLSYAGHGGKDGGSSSNGVLEKNLTLDLDARFSELMSRQANVSVIRGRTTDVYTESNARAAKVKSSGVDICIDHHVNSNAGTPGKGAEVLVSVKSKGVLGKLILEELVKLDGMVSRGIKQKYNSSGGDYYYMHRQTGSVETVIIEYGFINNDEDRNRLLQEDYRQQCAQAVVNAVLRYKNLSSTETNQTIETPISNPTQSQPTIDKPTIADIQSRFNMLLRGKVTALDVDGKPGPLTRVSAKKVILKDYTNNIAVTWVQRVLKYLGLYNGDIDAKYGPKTASAIRQFQTNYNLLVDGKTGSQTWGKLFDLMS